MKLTFYNTLTRKKEEFHSIDENRVRMYSCGPTVYSYAHIGNFRTYIFMDTLRRVLKYNGYELKHVMNITDVGHLESDADEGEDKMEKAARKEQKDPYEIANFYTEIFLKDMVLICYIKYFPYKISFYLRLLCTLKHLIFLEVFLPFRYLQGLIPKCWEKHF